MRGMRHAACIRANESDLKNVGMGDLDIFRAAKLLMDKPGEDAPYAQPCRRRGPLDEGDVGGDNAGVSSSRLSRNWGADGRRRAAELAAKIPRDPPPVPAMAWGGQLQFDMR